LVSGGNNLTTTEVLTEKGWENLLPPLPVTIDFGHCSVLLNSSTVVIISGVQSGSVSPKTYSFRNGIKGWTEGPTLIAAR
jgi:hypothetical protein